ncbi:BTB/POZ and MATH domain-containing protein 2 [Setaria italica]|nr:BTB/POZ and MATH domain-containing protein 2 [Setaria italica]
MGSSLGVPSYGRSSSSSSNQFAMPMPTTRVESRCVPRTAQGTLSFEVTGYRQLLKGFAGSFISSSSILVGGYSWCLRYYPDGDGREECKGFAGLYLELLTKNVVVKALFDFRLVDLTTGAPSVIQQLEVPLSFNTVDASRNQQGGGVATNKYLKRSELEASVYLRDDRLVIECEITVVNEPLVVETMKTTTVVEAPHRNLSRDFANLLESKEGADVTFEVQGEVIPAHTVVLAARSPVFKAQFYGPLREERGERHITVQDMQPAVFKELLYFIYADSMSPCIHGLGGDEKKEFTKHLLVAGDRYDVQGLRSVCETKLCESLDVSTVATMLAFADQNNCEKLKGACVEFMTTSCKLEDLVASNGYEDLKSSSPAVFVDLYEKAARARKI